MIEKTVTYKLLSFDELSEDQKEKVLDKYREREVDVLDSEDILYHSGIDQLTEETGFINAEWHCNINYVQGRGACFDCTGFDINKLLEGYFMCPINDELVKMIDSGIIALRIARPDASFAWHYTHENCRYFMFEYDLDEVMQEGMNQNPIEFIYSAEEVDGALESMEEYIEDKRHALCIKACKDLTALYELYTSDEFLATVFSDNDTYFNEQTLEIEEI